MTDTKPTTTPFDIATWQLEQRARAATLEALRPTNKATLFDALAEAGISAIIVEFDGYGDSGQIEGIEAKAGEEDAELPCTIITLNTLDWHDTEPTESAMAVREAIEHMAYDFLNQTHSGWENNEGAFGTFTFDVAERSIALDYRERFIDLECHEHRF